MDLFFRFLLFSRCLCLCYQEINIPQQSNINFETKLTTYNPYQSFLIKLDNSSSSLYKLRSHINSRSSILVISVLSSVSVQSCCICSSLNNESPFSAGKLLLTHCIFFTKNHPLVSVQGQCIHSSNPSLTLEYSELKNMEISGNLLHSGSLNNQIVRECLFDNITHTSFYPSESPSDCGNCHLVDSEISNGDEGIYGEIVSGLSGTLYSFACLNVSFLHCARYSITHTTTTHNQAYTSTEFTVRQGLPANQSYTFTNCNFTECKSDTLGGAIYINGTTENREILTISGCTFTSCTASTHGGGVYSQTLTTFIVDTCNFTSCSTSNNGGALYTASVSSCTHLTNTHFDSCSTENNGGGAFIFDCNTTTSSTSNTGIVSHCIFTSCYIHIGSYHYRSGGGLYLNVLSDTYFFHLHKL